MSSSGLEPVTFRLVAYCLNYYATACPLIPVCTEPEFLHYSQDSEHFKEDDARRFARLGEREREREISYATELGIHDSKSVPGREIQTVISLSQPSSDVNFKERRGVFGLD
jgi:hypothetical protein